MTGVGRRKATRRPDYRLADAGLTGRNARWLEITQVENLLLRCRLNRTSHPVVQERLLGADFASYFSGSRHILRQKRLVATGFWPMHNLTDERSSLAGEQDVFRVMFEQAGFGVAQVSRDGQWLAVNQSLCKILGYSRSQLLHKTLPRIARFDDIESELAECTRLLKGEIPSFSSQKRHLRGDGRVAWLKATITLVR